MPLPDISNLTDHTGYWLRVVSNAVSVAFARKLAERGVTVAEWVFVRMLFEAEASPTALADRMGMTRGAISKLADRLLVKGLLARAGHATDGRGQVLSLTPEGQRLVPVLAGLADANDAAFFGVLTAEERGMLDHLLQDLVARRGLGSMPLDGH